MLPVRPEPFTLRPAHPAEAHRLSDLALRSKAHWGYAADFIRACRGELTYTAGQIADPGYRFTVAHSHGAPIGFYALTRLSPREVELEALFVEPSWIGRGIGRALFDHARATARDWGAERLIIQGDPHAAGFYRAVGGVPAGHRESASIPGRRLPLFHVDLQPANHT